MLHIARLTPCWTGNALLHHSVYCDPHSLQKTVPDKPHKEEYQLKRQQAHRKSATLAKNIKWVGNTQMRPASTAVHAQQALIIGLQYADLRQDRRQANVLCLKMPECSSNADLPHAVLANADGPPKTRMLPKTSTDVRVPNTARYTPKASRRLENWNRS